MANLKGIFYIEYQMPIFSIYVVCILIKFEIPIEGSHTYICVQIYTL